MMIVYAIIITILQLNNVKRVDDDENEFRVAAGQTTGVVVVVFRDAARRAPSHPP